MCIGFDLMIYITSTNITIAMKIVVMSDEDIGFDADESTAIRPADAEGISTVHVEGFTV